MRELKDYLHLYLGQEMRYTGEGRPFRGTKVNEILSIENFELLAFSNQRKLVLRSLSDITEEESKEVDKYGSSGWRLINPPNEKNQNISLGVIHRQAAETFYLLSKGFDLFGLIESGLAIKKESL